MNWDTIMIKAAALTDAREKQARDLEVAKMKQAEQMANDLLLQLGTLLGDAIEVGKAAVNVCMDTPDVDYEGLTACIFGQCPEGFRLKISRNQHHMEAQMWALACPPKNMLDYVEHDFRDDQYF